MRNCFAFIITLGISHLAHAADSSYPAHWWQEVPRKSAKSWEILPQDAKEGEVILSKRTELGVFSNFAQTPFELDSAVYQSLEGFWQMMKFPEGKHDFRWKAPHWPHTRAESAK